MRGRPGKVGLDFWCCDVGFLDDEKFARAIANHGAVTVAGLVTLLLCRLYRHGYFYPWSRADREVFAAKAGFHVEHVEAVVDDLLKANFFDAKINFSSEKLTSQAIQVRYLAACRERTKVVFRRELCLVNPADFPRLELIGGENEFPGRESHLSGRENASINEFPAPKESKANQSREEKENAREARFTHSPHGSESQGEKKLPLTAQATAAPQTQPGEIRTSVGGEGVRIGASEKPKEGAVAGLETASASATASNEFLRRENTIKKDPLASENPDEFELAAERMLLPLSDEDEHHPAHIALGGARRMQKYRELWFNLPDLAHILLVYHRAGVPRDRLKDAFFQLRQKLRGRESWRLPIGSWLTNFILADLLKILAQEKRAEREAVYASNATGGK